MLQGRGKESGMADPGRGHLGQGGAGPDLLRTPDGNGGFQVGRGTGGAKGLSYLAGWGLLISSPFGGMVGGGRLDPQHLRVRAEVKVLSRDQQRPGS